MKPLLRALALGVGPLVVVAVGVGVLAQAQPPPPFISPSPVTVASCMQPPVFKTIYEVRQDYVVARDEGFYFGGESMLGADLCSGGILKITAAGEVAGGEQPQLTVRFDGEMLAAPRFDKERTVELRIPKAGQLFLGFFNDYYEIDSRAVVMQQIKLVGGGCTDFFKFEIAGEHDSDANHAVHTVNLVDGLPRTFTPCRAGEMRFRIIGKGAKEQLPVLQITQGNEIIYKQSVATNWNAMRLNVKQRPVTLRLLNPYWKILGDRNLNVKNIKFVPDLSNHTP